MLLTGASGAIGACIARTFGAAGAGVVGTYRGNRAAAEAALSETQEMRRHLLQAALDTPEDARELWRTATERADVDTLVVNAAAMTSAPLAGDQHAWDDAMRVSMDVNVIAATTLMREAAGAFADRGSGTLIVVSSWAGLKGSRIPEAAAYAASKAALRNYAQTLAGAYARSGVRVYIIAPGVVDAGMGVQSQTGAERTAVAEGLAMGQHVAAQEIADLAAFLASDRCPSLTGSTIDLNGASYIR